MKNEISFLVSYLPRKFCYPALLLQSKRIGMRLWYLVNSLIGLCFTLTALLFMESTIVAIIGSQRSTSARVVAHVATELNIPILSFCFTDVTIVQFCLTRWLHWESCRISYKAASPTQSTRDNITDLLIKVALSVSRIIVLHTF